MPDAAIQPTLNHSSLVVGLLASLSQLTTTVLPLNLALGASTTLSHQPALLALISPSFSLNFIPKKSDLKLFFGDSSFQSTTVLFISGDVFSNLQNPSPTGTQVLLCLIQRILSLYPDFYIFLSDFAGFQNGDNFVNQKLVRFSKPIIDTVYNQPYKPSDF